MSSLLYQLNYWVRWELVTGNQYIFVFSDIQDPVIRCPKNIVAETQPGHSKAEVSWVVPNPTDNWEKPSLSTLFPYEGIHPPYSFPIGQNTISYKAEDKAKRTSYCFFTVTVKGNIQ